MAVKVLNWFWLASLFVLPVQAADVGGKFHVPSFSLEELQLGLRSEDLLQALRSTGMLSVQLHSSSLGSQGFGLRSSIHRSVAMNGICHCLEELVSIPGIEGVDSIVLGDHTTRRSTVATATVGNSPLPLASRGILEEHCGQTTVEAMEFLRDQVAVVSDAFVRALDRLHMIYHDNANPLLRDNKGGSFSTLRSIVQSGNHLEHFHMYSKAAGEVAEKDFAKENSSFSLDWHTDAGLFLAFVPAWDCRSSGEQMDDSFWVQLENGEKAQAVFDQNTVVIMMGAGAQHWLHSSFVLRATRHAVRMEAGDVRSWYGMMHLVPENAIIQETPVVQTFGEMKENMKLLVERQQVYGEINQLDGHGMAIGCGPAIGLNAFDDDMPNEGSYIGSAPLRRRMQHVQDGSACNNATNFFCWMECIEIPNYKQAESYVNEGDSLYCLDPGVLARSGNSVAKAIEPCQGQVHNSNCMGVWHRTAPGIPGQKVNYNSTVDYDDDAVYCYGGTSMYMDGFHWVHDTTCIIYLFPQWVLSSRGKFVAACFGTLIFGVLVEFVISKRRDSITKMAAGTHRLLASAGFYGLQLAMGYMIMLVVMTYSIPLFLCCVLGLVGGHILFNSKDAVFPSKKTSAEIREDTSGMIRPFATYGSSEQKTASPVDAELIGTLSGCCCDATNECRVENSPDEDHDIPEGSTPCCQNVL